MFANFAMFAAVLFLMVALSIPVGLWFVSIAGVAKDKKLYSWELGMLSICFGSAVLCVTLYFATLLKVETFLAVLVLEATFMASFFYIKKKREGIAFDIMPFAWKQDGLSRTLVIFLFCLFFYYSIQPLTLEYGFTRDYDAAALGLKQSGRFVLPIYNIETYYPPLVATIGAHFSKLIGYVFFANTNKVMMAIFSLVIFLVSIISYFIGFFLCRLRKAGICFLTMFAFVTATRNAVIGGSTYSAILANFYFSLFILILIEFFDRKNQKVIFFSGVFLAGIFLSHLDIGFSFLWFACALLITGLLFYKPKREITKFLGYSFLMATFVSGYYFWYGFTNKSKFSFIWTACQWLSKIHGESHPKPLTEIAFFVGTGACYIVLISLIIYLCYIVGKRKNREIWLYVFFLLWCGLLLLQNSYVMLYASRPFIHLYPLNVIMWAGLLMFLICSGGYGLYLALLYLEKMNKKYATIFITLLFFGAFLSIVDYETINIQRTYRPGAGYLWSALAEKNVVVTAGDNEILQWLRKQRVDGNILVPDTYAGYYCVIATEKNATLTFYESESYHDPSYMFRMSKLINDTVDFFREPNSDKSFAFLKKHHISYIYLPAAQGAAEFNGDEKGGRINLCYHPSLFSDNFIVVKRANGAKVLRFVGAGLRNDGKNTRLRHIEAELCVSGIPVKEYFFSKSIYRKTAVIAKGAVLTIPLELQSSTLFRSKGMTLHINHLSTPVPVHLKVSLGDYSDIIVVRTNKFMFSESTIEVPVQAYAGLREPLKLQLTVIPETQNLRNKFYKIFPMEIDWVEVEQII